MSTLQINLQIYRIPIKIPISFFLMVQEKTNPLKFIWKNKVSGKIKTTLERMKGVGDTLLTT